MGRLRKNASVGLFQLIVKITFFYENIFTKKKKLFLFNKTKRNIYYF